MKQLSIETSGPYSLEASIQFLEGFTPAAYASELADHLHLAFVVDGGEDVAGVCLRSEGEQVLVEVYGDGDAEVVRRQVARILSLDVDGRAWPLVGQRDPVIGGLQARYSGLRPVCFFSPYEATVWALISHRIRITQAARIKAQMTRELGSGVDVHGVIEYAFPGPSRLLALNEFPGLFGRKMEYLHQLAEATLEGKLDAAFLRSLEPAQAIEQMKLLPGIGEFSAQLVILRGTGEPDFLPTHEPRLARAFALAYGPEHRADEHEVEQVAEAWRPYRTWASFLLRVLLEDETHEIERGTGSRRR